MLSIVVEKENIFDNKVRIINTNDIKHIINVYRLNINDEIRIVDGEYEYETKIEKISKKEILVKVILKKPDNYTLKVNIDVALGIIKNDKMKLAIQKLTEIGVSNIIPLKTERVIVKIDEKKEKWDDIVKESMKQCRAIKKTNLLDIIELKKIDIMKYDKIFFLYEASESNKKLFDILNSKDKNILLIVGPEGGFTKNEVEYMRKNSFFELSLGKRIYRAETAAIVMAGIVAYSFGI